MTKAPAEARPRDARPEARRRSAGTKAGTADRIDRSVPDWYKDAVIYQVHVKAYQDSDNDGVGDFQIGRAHV